MLCPGCFILNNIVGSKESLLLSLFLSGRPGRRLISWNTDLFMTLKELHETNSFLNDLTKIAKLSTNVDNNRHCY